MDRLLLLSSDDHAGAMPDTYRKYVEARFLDDFDAWVGIQTPRQEELARRRVQSSGDTARIRAEMMEDEERERFHWDLPFRLERLERDGIVGEVLFPDSIGTGLGVPFAGLFGDGNTFASELVAAGYAAHNRWQAENIDPSRQIGLAMIAYHDIDAAVREIQWARAAGLRGVLFYGIDPDYPPLHDAYFDPVWAACADAALPVHFHAGNGGMGALRATGARSGNGASEGVDRCIQVMDFPQFDRRPLVFMINGGVFDRHPGLRIVFAEQGALWARRSIRQNDWAWENLGFRDSNCRRRPSEYFPEHVFFAVSNPFSRSELDARHETGINQIMWGGDHPHFGSPWGVTTEWLRATFGACHVPEAEARVLLAENLVRLYGLDLPQLNAVADRVGPTVADALREPDAADLDHATIKVNLARPEDG
jgi:predicted TIM-barrel fold metal-dependent hydrolase